MLVLSRNKGESIIIDNGRIVVEVIDVRGNKVRIGITAPKETRIFRSEVQAKIDAQKLATGYVASDETGLTQEQVRDYHLKGLGVQVDSAEKSAE